jgi:hypothetical protein
MQSTIMHLCYFPRIRSMIHNNQLKIEVIFLIINYARMEQIQLGEMKDEKGKSWCR